jgi:hypothetical protein
VVFVPRPIDASAAPGDGSVPAPASVEAPWTDAAYTPQFGHWQDYVLGPSSRLVHGTSIVQANAYSGSITGNPADALTTDGRGLTLTSTTNRNGSPLLTIDFGQEMAGYAQVTLLPQTAAAPPVRACFSESLQFMAAPSMSPSNQGFYAPGCDVGNFPDGYIGPYAWDGDSHLLFPGGAVPTTLTLTDNIVRGGFRYATIFLDGPGSVSVDSLEISFAGAPTQADLRNYQGWFLSSDNLLNKIWYAGAYTVQVDTASPLTAKSWPLAPGEPDQANQPVTYGPNSGASPTPLVGSPTGEVTFDGAKRDRQVWQGDFGIEGPVTYLSTGDVAAVDNSLSVLASQQQPNGNLPGASQGGDPWNVSTANGYGEYVEWFVNNMAQHYLWTGDRGYLDEWYSTVSKAMTWLETGRDATGLLSFDNTTPSADGEYAYSGGGHETYTNALYVMNLRQMAVLAGVEGNPALAAQDSAEADTITATINGSLWDPAAGAYRYSLETAGYPQDANAFAVTTGVAPASNATAALTHLAANNWNTFGSLDNYSGSGGPVPSTYQQIPSYGEVMARFQAGDSNGALQLMRTFWGHQLAADGPQSTWWENMAQDGTPGLGSFTSLAHGWGSGPTVALTTDVLGVAPDSAGFQTYDVTPHVGDLQWAQGQVPTKYGGIAADWLLDQSTGSVPVGFRLDVAAPSGTTGTVAVPLLGASRVINEDGQIVWDGNGPVGGITASTDGTYVRFADVAAGAHLFSWGVVPQTSVAESPWVAFLVLVGLLPMAMLPLRRPSRWRHQR